MARHISQKLLQCLISHKTNTYTRNHLVVFRQNPSIQPTHSFSSGYVPKGTKKASCIDMRSAPCPFQLLPAPHKIQRKCCCILQWRINEMTWYYLWNSKTWNRYTRLYQGHKNYPSSTANNPVNQTETNYWCQSNMESSQMRTAL